MPAPRQRRERCAFHYKVDELLTVADREAYTQLLREPRTTIDGAHTWLGQRGYVLSRSAVARHRRRLLTADAERAAERELAKELGRLAGTPNAPDFAAGAAMQWQHVVFQRLMAAGECIDAEYNGASREKPPMPTPAELILLGKLVEQSIELTRRRMNPTHDADDTASG